MKSEFDKSFFIDDSENVDMRSVEPIPLTQEDKDFFNSLLKANLPDLNKERAIA